jgi:hypothetical protein
MGSMGSMGSMVGTVGIEPTSLLRRRILSPLRLPASATRPRKGRDCERVETVKG